MHIGKQIANQAKQRNICEEWHADLMSIKDKDQLIHMYLKGIDFCIENDFPPLDFIRKNFAGITEKHGIYIDCGFKAIQSKKVVALGNCIGKVEIGAYGTCEVFVRHNSRVSIEATGNAFVMVNVYDSGEADVTAKDKAMVCIHNYSAMVNYQTSDNARVKLINKVK